MKLNSKSQARTKADSEQKDEDMQVRQRSRKPNVVRPAFSCPPYELTREEFDNFQELFHPDCASQSRAIRGSQNKMMRHAEIMDWLSFDTHKWLYQKALNGDKEALFKLEYSYDLYNEVVLKAKEQNLL
jgi:hypothetical protein